MTVPSLEEMRRLLALADHPDQGPCDAIRFDQASGALMRGLLGKQGPEYLDAHNTCLHALVDGLRKLGRYKVTMFCRTVVDIRIGDGDPAVGKAKAERRAAARAKWDARIEAETAARKAKE